MAILRTDIERALDELVSNEEGMRFQALAVVLAKQKWPDLIASERHRDGGLDAYAPASVAEDKKAKGLASSITGTITKIKDDATSIKKNFPDVEILIFATPRKVTNPTIQGWAEEIRTEFGYELVVMTREDIITSLMIPSNAPLCRTLLAINVPAEATEAELLARVREAVTEEAQNWRARLRTANRPIVSLQAVRLDSAGKETSEIIDTAGIRRSLAQARRIALEAPGGGGKTTTLVQLATETRPEGELTFLIDLPAWIQSRADVLEFIGHTPSFRSRNIGADDLARLYKSEHFSFLLNGWNEITELHSEEAMIALRQLERSFPAAGIVVATRTHYISPPLPGSFRAKLLPFNRRQRADYLNQTLGDRANELRLQLESNRVLDELTRTPLILAEVVTIFQSGGPIPTTRIGVLGAVMTLIDNSDEHRTHLQRPPLAGGAHHYLKELAAQMTGRGEVITAEDAARGIIQSVSEKLKETGQIAVVPDPAMVLHALCAHHVLERLEYPSVTFRFQHQQFQEFYAARFLASALASLVENGDQTADRAFAASYINKPMWEEPLRMVSEETRLRSEDDATKNDAITTGARLIDLALGVDPILAADLSRLSGSTVWDAVRAHVGKCLRDWYAVGEPDHKQCALAAMLATGSDDFSDILVPLLTDPDRQVRVATYQAGEAFYPESLGTDWRRVVDGWDEESRADFVYEVIHRGLMADIGESLAIADPSEKVRAQAIEALSWIGATEALTRVVNALDDAALETALPAFIPDSIPSALRGRVVAANRRLLAREVDPLARIRHLLQAVEFDDADTAVEMMVELKRLPAPPLDQYADHAIDQAIKIVRQGHPQWASDWLAARLLAGTMWGDQWQTSLLAAPRQQVDELIDRLATQEIQPREASAIRTILSASVTLALARQVFDRLCEVQRAISSGGPAGNPAWIWFDQLRSLFRALPAEIAFAGLQESISGEFDTEQFRATVQILGRVGADAPELRSALPDELRQSLRRYLKDGIAKIVADATFDDANRSYAAVTLGRIGDAEDLADLRGLIDADIQRQPTRGGSTDYSNWFVLALQWLDAPGTEAILIDLLRQAKYERSAAHGLLRLATPADRQKMGFGSNRTDYEAIWSARAGNRTGIDEARAKRYAQAIKQRIAELTDERSKAANPDQYLGRLKGLAVLVAMLDGRGQADLVMNILALPGKWDDWDRMNGVKALLLSGAALTLDTMLKVLDPAIENLLSQGLYNDQNLTLLTDCLSLLPFSDDPARGLRRIEEVMSRFEYRPYQFRDLVAALGHSRSEAAVEFLLKLARGTGGLQNMEDTWIHALGRLNLPAARQVLLSFIDPEISWVGITINFDFRSVELFASYLAEWARRDPGLKQRLFTLSENTLTPMQRQLLPAIYAEIDSAEAMLAGVNFIQGNMVPYGLGRGLESLFLERRHYDNSGSFIYVPRKADQVRAKLFQMVLHDPQRRKAAFSILGQVEVWRIEHGRPNGEPRHPMIETGEPWPPVSFLK